MSEGPDELKLGVYANTCLTLIAGCLLYLAYAKAMNTSRPTAVEIVGIASSIDAPMPCKLMFKAGSPYALRWIDTGAIDVQVVNPTSPKSRLQVEIVDVSGGIKNPLPIQGLPERERGILDSSISKQPAIPVRLVGIERPSGFGSWDAIPVRGVSTVSGESGGLIGIPPVEVKVVR